MAIPLLRRIRAYWEGTLRRVKESEVPADAWMGPWRHGPNGVEAQMRRGQPKGDPSTDKPSSLERGQ